MGAVAQVRGDENEIRKGIRREVQIKIRQRADAPLTARGVQSNWVEVHERVVLLGVVSPRADETRPEHVLLVGLPRPPAGFDQVGQAGRIDETILAVAINFKSISADHGNVVGQAGMGHRVVLGEQGVVVCQAVEDRHVRVINDPIEFLVFKDDDGNGFEVRDQRRGRGTGRDRGDGRHGRGDGCRRGGFGRRDGGVGHGHRGKRASGQDQGQKEKWSVHCETPSWYWHLHHSPVVVS